MPDNGDTLLTEILQNEMDEALTLAGPLVIMGGAGTPTEEEGKDAKSDKENHSQWALGGNGRFMPVGSTVEKLPAGIYEPFAAPGMWGLEHMSISSDGIYILPDMATEIVLAEVKKFWESEVKYREHKLLYKRGLILWGPPGGGKTITVKILMNELVKRDGIVMMASNINLAVMCMKAIRRIEPNRNLIVVLEDIDEIINHNGEAIVLSMLDGENNIDNVLHLATCHTPDTRFLTKDLKWLPCGELKVGDKLWAFDEGKPTGRGARRRYRESTVLLSEKAKKACVKLTLNTGETFTCTEDHPWLSSADVHTGKSVRLGWTVATDLMSRPNLVRPFIPWEIETSYEAGWLAGILDGEGSIPKRIGHGGPSNVSVAQNKGMTADRIRDAILLRGSAHVYMRTGTHEKQQIVDTIGGLAAALKLIGQVRANRLINRVDLTDGMMHNKFPAKVIKVEYIGVQEVQSIQTSTKTYIAEGFASHNTNYPERLGARIINRPSRFDRRVFVDMPGAEARKVYLNKATKGQLAPETLDAWVNDTHELSIAHLRELVAAVYCLEQPYDEVIDRLKAMAIQPKGDEEFKRKNMGFSKLAQSMAHKN